MDDRERLSRWIDEQDKTVTQIAAEMGIQQAYLSSVKGGSRKIGAAFCWRFQETYGTEVAAAIFADRLKSSAKKSKEPVVS